MAEENRKFTYYAFISYKHGDMKWGRWLQRKLEHYRLPGVLCREFSLPRRLTPIFRDETDLLAGKPVHDNLLDKLSKSKYLIVICSRKMQHHPEYIDYEIRQFLALGNPISHILPIIVDGEGVAADPANEAMPPALLDMGEQRPLGITMDHRRKQDVILKLVASMLNLELQTIRTHDQQRQQKRLVSILTLGLCAALGLGSLMTWEFLSVKWAQMREQLTYTQSTYQAGDRIKAIGMAEEILAENPIILMEDISLQAKKLSTAASITPIAGSITALEMVSSDSRIIPCTDGSSFVIMSANAAKRYDLQGNRTLDFMANEAGSKLYDVSPDGRHALVLSYPTEEMLATTLWLWDMEENQRIACLTANQNFDLSRMSAGDFGDVTHGAFSPDGSLVCAYAANGYFSQNERLQVFDSGTGEVVADIPGELLITGPGNSNAAKTVESFEFISDTLLHWRGPINHVYYDMTTGRSAIVSLRDARMAEEDGFIVLYGRYAVMALEGKAVVFDLATEAYVQTEVPGTQMEMQEGVTAFGQYVIIPTLAMTENEEGVLQDLLIVDVTTLTAVFRLSEAYPDACGKYASLNIMNMEGSGRVYAFLSKGVKTGGRLGKAASDIFICLDAETGIGSRVTNLSYTWLESDCFALGSRGDSDWIISNANGQARLMRITSGAKHELTYPLRTVETCLLDTLFADAVRSFELVGSQECPRLVSVRSNEYYLGALVRPGVRLDAGLDMDATQDSHTAASDDGRTILKAQGKRAALWHNSTLSWSVKLDRDAYSACLSRDGSQALISAGGSACVYDAATGTLLYQYDAEEGNIILHTKLSDDGRLALLAIADVNRVGEKQMQLLVWHMQGTEQPALLTEYAYYRTSGDFGQVFDLSGDGRYAAVIEYLPVESQFQRAVSVFDPATGALLARTPVAGNSAGCPVLDVSAYFSSSVAFDFLTFGDDKILMAGLNNGVWIFDMETMETRCFIPDGSEIEGLPLLKNGREVLYPAGGLHAWDIDGPTMLGTVSADTSANIYMDADAVFAAGEIALSADESLLAITGVNKTMLVDTESWQMLGGVASSAVHVVYLDHSRFVYETGSGLYELIY